MCGPAALPIAALAVTVVQAGAQYMGQRQAAQDQADYAAQQVKERDRQIQENYKSAMRAYNLKNIAEGVRMEEVRSAAAHQAFQVAQAAARAKATVINRASYTGAGGNSLLVAIQDILGQAGYQTNNILGNLQSERGQSRRNLEAFHQEAVDRINSVQPYQPGTIRGPSLFGPILTIAGGALTAASSYQTNQQLEKLTASGSAPGGAPLTTQ